MSDSRVDFADTDEENQDENDQEIEDPAQILFEEDAWDIFEHLDQEYDGYLRYDELEGLKMFSQDENKGAGLAEKLMSDDEALDD